MSFWSIAGTAWGLVAIGLVVADAVAVLRQGKSAFSGVYDDGLEHAIDVSSRAVLWPVTVPLKLLRRRRARAQVNRAR